MADEWLASKEVTARDLKQREEAHDDALVRVQDTQVSLDQDQSGTNNEYNIDTQILLRIIQPQPDDTTTNDPNDNIQDPSIKSKESDSSSTEKIPESNHRYPRQNRKAPTNFTSDLSSSRE